MGGSLCRLSEKATRPPSIVLLHRSNALGSLRHCPRAELCQSHANCRLLSLQDFQALSVDGKHQSNNLLLLLGAHEDSPTLRNRSFLCLWRRFRMSSVRWCRDSGYNLLALQELAHALCFVPQIFPLAVLNN